MHNMGEFKSAMRNRLPLFYAVTSLFWFALYAYVPYVAPYAEEMHTDVRMIGLITGSYGFTQMAIRFPLGIFSDKLRKRRIFIIVGLLFAAASGLVVYISPSPVSLLAARSLAGIAASSWVIFAVLCTAYKNPDETVKTMGILNACNSFGRMTALLFGGIVAEWHGFSYAFLLSGLAGLVGLALSSGIVEKSPKSTEPPKLSALMDVARDQQLLCTSLLAIFTQYLSFATTFGFTPIVATGLGATNLQLGLLGVASTLPGLFIAPFAGTLVNKLGAKKTLIYCFLLSALSSMAMPLTQQIWHLFVIQILNNIGLITAYTTLMGLCLLKIPVESHATGMGFFQAVYGLGMFLGPFVMGFLIHELGLVPAFALTGSIGLVAGILTVVFVNKGYMSDSC